MLSFCYDYPPEVYRKIKEYGAIPKYRKERGFKCRTDFKGQVRVIFAPSGERRIYKDAEEARKDLEEYRLKDIPQRVEPMGAQERAR